MLYAINAKKKLQSLYQMSKSELELAKQTPFWCPVCEETVSVRIGSKVIPHFAHRPDSTCASNKGSESMEHEKGKWTLYHWLRNQGYHAQLEHYIKSLKQKPDLWVKTSSKRIAIEYQCSTITVKEVQRRTAKYLSTGIFPFWLLGNKHFQKQGFQQLNLNAFVRTFLYHWPHGYQLFFFDSNQNRVNRASHIKWTGPRQALASIQSYPLKEISFPQLFSPDDSFIPHHLYQHLKKSWHDNRTHYRKQVGSAERNYRQYLYLRGYHFSMIPSLCYLPVDGQVQMDIPPYIWQTRLMIDHFMDVPNESILHFPAVYPNPTLNGYKPDLAQQYLSLLSKLNIVRKTGKNNWVKIKQVSFHQFMEDGLRDDQTTLEHLKNIKRI
ncbi:competence protein CoiA [Halobacillus litoralis]|uniref:competence protein CoiA n=1 Tax=Halobacillus litoralis TaxID=45668 RepID=UPI001CFED49D|nr:competence protein CoiA family protein [Halobacillus litoralis]